MRSRDANYRESTLLLAYSLLFGTSARAGEKLALKDLLTSLRCLCCMAGVRLQVAAGLQNYHKIKYKRMHLAVWLICLTRRVRAEQVIMSHAAVSDSPSTRVPMFLFLDSRGFDIW